MTATNDNLNRIELTHGHINGNGTFHAFFSEDFLSLLFISCRIIEGDVNDLYVRFVKSRDRAAHESYEEILSFGTFMYKYIERKAPLVLDECAAIYLTLGIVEGGQFLAFSDNTVFKYSPLDDQSRRDYYSTVKHFKIQLDYVPRMRLVPAK